MLTLLLTAFSIKQPIEQFDSCQGVPASASLYCSSHESEFSSSPSSSTSSPEQIVKSCQEQTNHAEGSALMCAFELLRPGV